MNETTFNKLVQSAITYYNDYHYYRNTESYALAQENLNDFQVLCEFVKLTYPDSLAQFYSTIQKLL